MTEARPLTPKAARTRARILDAALALFRERGYDATTMRAVAERAEVSTGNAYYYFASKDELVQGFYRWSHEAHVAACRDLLDEERDLAKRLRGVLRAKIETAEPYHEFSVALYRQAADPENALNPFSEASRPLREECIELMREVFEGSRQKLPKDLAAEMPRLLWLMLMGVVLFWLHDRSPGRRRTEVLLDRGTDLVVKLVKLAGNPLVSPLRRSTLKLLRELSAEAA